MNQKTIDILDRVKNKYLWVDGLDDFIDEAISALTTPKPEASDREIAADIVGMGAAYGAGNDRRKIGEIVDDACQRVATIRADERRKTDELRSIMADLIASEPSNNDPRLDYIEIQIDRKTYNDARSILGNTTE